jgi:hypothetical protein
LANFDEGIYKVTALDEITALHKAMEMMLFINNNIQWLISTQIKPT